MKNFYFKIILLAFISLAFISLTTCSEDSGDRGLVFIQGGTFTMGSTDVFDNASPPHQVTVSSFYMSRYPIVQIQYEAVMGANPSTSVIGDKHPVETVSWYDAIVFCNKLSIDHGLRPVYNINNKTNPEDWGPVPTSNDPTWNAAAMAGGANGYRLPTEAELEYACRAGTTTAYNTGDSINTTQANYGSVVGSTTQAGSYAPNAYGLYDMHGNVFEWCWDRHGSYGAGHVTNPEGASSGSDRVRRGGSWGSLVAQLRSAYRVDVGLLGSTPNYRNYNIGFRVVRQ